MKTEIQELFQQNLERVEGLLQVYRDSADGQGRRPVAATDILRSAVVFLHASLEDLLRSCLTWRWPHASPEHFEGMPFLGGRAEKLSLPQLATHRGRSVQDLLEGSVADFLARSNFNNPGEIRKALGRIGSPESTMTPHVGPLQAMMTRRHHIVHRADRNEMRGRGHHVARPLSASTVEKWRDAVRGFGEALLATLE